MISALNKSPIPSLKNDPNSPSTSLLSFSKNQLVPLGLLSIIGIFTVYSGFAPSRWNSAFSSSKFIPPSCPTRSGGCFPKWRNFHPNAASRCKWESVRRGRRKPLPNKESRSAKSKRYNLTKSGFLRCIGPSHRWTRFSRSHLFRIWTS